MDEDDDLSDDYISDSERISRLEKQITELRVRTEQLERQIREMDVAQIRTQMAVLEERVESLLRRETVLRDRLNGIGGLLFMVFAVSAANLLITLFGR
jgi:predicted  nucleic acid-binding Zn-ribbon protein